MLNRVTMTKSRQFWENKKKYNTEEKKLFIINTNKNKYKSNYLLGV